MVVIKVTPEELNTKAQEFFGLAERLQRNYQDIYEKVEALRGQWNGEGFDAFYTRIQGFKNDLESLKLLLEKYSEYLETEHANYLNAEAQIIESARDKLTSGV